ncbi:hypothetical protein [Pseudomonas sp.]|uniref:hypothetical protein n=1 Tax=Pseudomonas sp. TaxID=306 RepID=UPI003FD6F1F0
MDTVSLFQYADSERIYDVHIVVHGDWVGGGILTHGVPVAHHWVETVSQSTGGLAWLMPTLLNAVAGIIAGALVLALVTVAGKTWRAVRG